MTKPTKKQILAALETLQTALDCKYPRSEEATICIRPSEANLGSDATDNESIIVATGFQEIAEEFD